VDKEFQKTLGLLNEQQKKAVNAIDGPVLVIAGPGTGKTQLLSARVANILKSTDSNPSNILCLTFTNKAAVNMKSRIIDQAGPAGARVVASTFHSFAAEIMNLYPDHFWSGARLSVAPESVQLDLVESIVKTLPLDNPLALKFAGQYTLLSDIQRAINLVKDAGLTPDKLRAVIIANLAYIDVIEPRLVEILEPRLSIKSLDELVAKTEALPKQTIDRYVYPLRSLSTVISDSLAEALMLDEATGKTTNTGKWKSRWVQSVNGQKSMQKERQRNDWWLKLADVYEQYRDDLHVRGFYDYADMLVEVIAQLEQNPQILADVQERFNYVLIDEFQDTTPAQLRLAHLVADHHSSGGRPNLMVVGDDDQSIFKFNGAELNNLLGFKSNYPSAKVIVLNDNYRSTQSILDTAEKIIEQAQSRLVRSDPSLDKNLIAKAPPKAAGQIKALSFASRELQLSEIARAVKKAYKPGREIAVLARGHDSLIKMAAILQELEVPLRYEQASNILDHEIVEQVYLVAKLTLAIQDGDAELVNSLVHKIARWPAWGIAPQQLWELAVSNYPNKDWLSSLGSSKSPELKALGEWFKWLAAHADAQPLAITIEQIIGLRPSGDYTSPLRDYFTDTARTATNRYFHGLSAIQLLRALVYEFGEQNQPSLTQLVRFIEINQQNGVIVADESPFVTGSQAVSLLSVHKAKGLEFDEVFVIDATDDNWRPKAGGRKAPANLPLQPVGDDFDDYVRLLYVAATRAKSSLTFSMYHQDHSGREVAASSIVQAAMTIEKVDERDQQRLIPVLEESLRWPELSGGIEKEMLKARLETYNLSVTHLLNFLDVSRGGPQYFKERNLLHLPEAKTPSLSYGTAMHAALDSAQKLTNKGSFSLPEIDKDFSRALSAEQLSASDQKRYLAKGKQTIERLFKEFGYQLPSGSLSEQKLRDIVVGKALIDGKLDRIDEKDGKLTIIDYKTGSPLNSFETKDKIKAVKAYKHKLQLVFYALLMEGRAGAKAGIIECQMVYVEAETPKQLVLSYQPTPADKQHLQKLVEAVWQKIVNLDLPDTSSYPKDIEGIKAFEADLIK